MSIILYFSQLPGQYRCKEYLMVKQTVPASSNLPLLKAADRY